MTYAFATSDAETREPTVAIMAYELKLVPLALGGRAYMARSVVVQRFFFNTSSEADAFAALHNDQQDYRARAALLKKKASDRAAAMNALATA